MIESLRTIFYSPGEWFVRRRKVRSWAGKSKVRKEVYERMCEADRALLDEYIVKVRARSFSTVFWLYGSVFAFFILLAILNWLMG